MTTGKALEKITNSNIVISSVWDSTCGQMCTYYYRMILEVHVITVIMCLGIYRKILIISPGLIFVQKAFWWAYFQGSLFSQGLIIGRNFAFQNGLGLTIKTANSNSPWAYIREGLLSEGYLRLRFGAYFQEGLFLGGLIIRILQYLVRSYLLKFQGLKGRLSSKH